MRRVLVIDDEKPIREACEAALTQYNIHVDLAEGVTEAQSLLADNEYDVVVCDGLLPDGSGTELAGHVHRNGIPVVFISGSETAPDGIVHLRKPFMLLDLCSIVGGLFK